ncbi:MAG TPA: hypothetical protein PL045_06910, partial [Chitinophagaceae bacterium]|nr:hypothetical protein [Chitinophagaceae bacterium]
ILLGVSQTSSPSGSYWIWALDATADGSTHTSNWADYPSLGYDTQAIYITTNQFSFSSSGFQYAKLRILNKSEVYGGGVGGGHTIKWYDFWNLKDSNGGTAFTVQPCVHHRGIGGNPAGYLINSGFGAGSFLSLWTLNDPIGYWSGRSPSLVRDNISCRSYDLPPEADQPGSATNIATNDNRILNAVFQYAGGVQRVWACHTSKGTWAGDSSARAVLQWYEVDVISKTVIQQNYFGASGMYYFFPAIEVDINRNAFIVFSRSSASEYGSVRQTGRRVTDSLNTLQGSASVKTGEGVYNGGRWGDYFGICRDGADSTRIWGYGEYAKTGDRWGTWVYSAKF